MKAVVWGGMICAAGLLAGLAWPPPPIPRSQLAQTDTWSLPDDAALERTSLDAMQRARTGLRWAGEADASVDGNSVGPWQLLGLAETPDPVALVSAGGQVQRLGLGDALPDGRRLVEIGRDRVIADDGACQETYQLYRPDPIHRSGVCTDLPSE